MSTQRILAATDFSEGADAAAERAARLCAESGASLHLLHIANLPAVDAVLSLFGAESRNIRSSLAEAAEKSLADAGTRLSVRHRVAVATDVRSGNVAPEILAAAEEGAADLIVLGARGENRVKDLLFGATAERTIGRATRPVLAVERWPSEAYRHVLVPIDFSEDSRSALRLARAVAPWADITLLHAFEFPYEGKLRFAGIPDWEIAQYPIVAKRRAMAELNGWAADSGSESSAIGREVVHGPPAPSILEQAAYDGTDLIVMGKHGRSRLEEWFLGSVTRHVLSAAPCDVLVTSLAACR
jgi:nucleotide-binding universal stress UspA family protein